LGYLIFCRRTENPEKTAVTGFLTGGISLLAAYFASGFFGIIIPVNLFTAALALSGGVPFVLFLIIYAIL
ncbi:MAG: pro-sigmaK processing inhibitor BofA family protein, partial [Oscillospiraceae bacterium]